MKVLLVGVGTVGEAIARLSAGRPWLEKLGLGRLPGDFRWRMFGREFHVPLTSSVLLALIAMGIARLF